MHQMVAQTVSKGRKADVESHLSNPVVVPEKLMCDVDSAKVVVS